MKSLLSQAYVTVPEGGMLSSSAVEEVPPWMPHEVLLPRRGRCGRRVCTVEDRVVI